MPILGELQQGLQRPLLILAERFYGTRWGCWSATTGWGSGSRWPSGRRVSVTGESPHLHDLAAFTGGNCHLQGAGPDARRRCARALRDVCCAVINQYETVLVDGPGLEDDIDARLAQIRVELSRATQDTDIEVLQERLARLASKLAVIRVGGATEPELKEKVRRTEGSLAATRAAAEEGSSPAAAPRCCGPRPRSMTSTSRSTTCAARR